MKTGKTAQDYRETGWKKQPKPPEKRLPDPGSEFPKHVVCFDGAKRTVNSAEEEAQCTRAAEVEPLPAEEKKEESAAAPEPPKEETPTEHAA